MTSMMKRLLLLVAAVTGLAWAVPAPVSAGAGGCKQAVRTETGASDIVTTNATGRTLAVYEDNAIEPTEVALDPRVTVRVALAAPSCSGVYYNVAVYDDAGLQRQLGSASITGNGSDVLTLLDNASIDRPSTPTVYFVIWTSSARSSQIDRAPDTGAVAHTDGTGPGQSWH